MVPREYHLTPVCLHARRQSPAAGGKKDGPRGAYTEPRDSAPTLADAGIDKKLSAHAQSGGWAS